MSRKETEVLRLVGEHLTNAEIAARLYVSERTVESHVSSLLRKLEVTNRRALAGLAQFGPEPVGSARPPPLPAALELAAESGPLIGRRDELARLVDLWRRAAAGRALIAVVTGEAGIGKSRLVADLAAEVHRGGWTVLLGACFEDVPTPYQPFVQAIGDNLAGLTDDDARRRLAGAGRTLGRLLPELRDATEITVHEPGGGGDLRAAVCGYLTRAAEATPLLLVLEDLHWATATTRDTLRHLVRTAGRVPLLVVATSRDTPPDATNHLATFLGELARYPAVQRLGLDGLGEDDVRDLIVRLHGSDGVLDPREIRVETGGNPLLVREIVTGAARRWAVGSPVQSLLAVRSQRLSREDNTLLDMAAVVGAEFDADVIATAGDTPMVEVLDALERAEAAGLINPAPARPGRFAFVHALFRSSRYEAIPTGRRLESHRRVTSALAPRSDDDRVIPQLAHHACAAAPLFDPRAAIGYARRAADLGARSLAFDEAAAQYRRALNVADHLDPPDLALRCELMTRLGQMLFGAGDPQGRALLKQAAHAALRLGNAELLAATAWSLSPYAWGMPGFDRFAHEIAEEALAGLGPEPTATRARLLAVLGGDNPGGVEPQPGRPAFRAEAIGIAHQLDDPAVLGQVLLASLWSNWSPDNLDQRTAAADELDRLGDRLGEPAFRFVAQAAQARNHLERGDVAACVQAIDLIEVLVGEYGAPAPALGIAGRRAMRLFLTGDLAAAEHAAENLRNAAETVAPAFGLEPMNVYVPLLTSIRFNQGRVGEVVPLMQAVATASPNLVAFQASLALALGRSGDLAAAGLILRRLTDNRVADLRRDWQWHTAMISLADAAEMTADLTAAAELDQQLTPYSGRLAHPGNAGVGHPIDIALAQLALTRSDNQRAETIAEKAVYASRRMNTPIFLARALVQLAAARQRLGRHKDETSPLVDEALAIAQRTGARLIEQEASRYTLK